MSERTIRPSEWQDACRTQPILSGSINETVAKCLGGLVDVEGGGSEYSPPWPKQVEFARGAMWAGVPTVGHCHQDKEGGWIVSDDFDPGQGRYIRLSPAHPDAEVQYGFCPFVLDRFQEFGEKTFGPRQKWRLKKVAISPLPTALIRVDCIIEAAINLANPNNTSEAARRAQGFFRTIPLDTFILDLLGKCYCDMEGDRNILGGTSREHQEIIGMVVEEAYPNLLNPSAFRGLGRFRLVMDLPPHKPWRSQYLWPILYNVVMPQAIFDLVEESLKEGKPPIVPQYATVDSHMFNGPFHIPCTGVRISPHSLLTSAGGKIVGGVTNQFNLDMPGRASFWPPQWNPPEDWIQAFIGVVKKFTAELCLPLAPSEKVDLAFFHARRIPVMFSEPLEVVGVNRFARLTEIEKDEAEYMTKVITRECDATGQEWLSEARISCGSNPFKIHDQECEECGCPPEDRGEDYICSACCTSLCTKCSYHCEACERSYCHNCDDNEWLHRCQHCEECDETITEGNWSHCPTCKVEMCVDCSSHRCEKCELEACEVCLESHECSEEEE